MTLLEASERRKLPVWRTVRASYATVLQNLGQLVRISWLWLLIMVPVYAAGHWLTSIVWAAGIQTRPRWVGEFVVVLHLVVELPFLASIAVAWHRLVLRHEHVSTSAYLRLDTSVWLYALCSLGLLALTTAPLLCALDIARQPFNAPPHFDAATTLSLALIALALAAAIFLLPRLSLVLPPLALGERLSLRDTWLATRGNTLRLALATCLCMLPALFLVMVLPLLSLLLSELLQRSWEWTTGLNLINQLLDSIGYAVFNSLACAVLTIFAVTLLSLTYRFFVAPRDERASA